MNRTKKALLTAGVASTLAVTGLAPASAGMWFPSEPSSAQPVGSGAVCAKIGHGDHWDIYRWLTTSLGTTSCEYTGWVKR